MKAFRPGRRGGPAGDSAPGSVLLVRRTSSLFAAVLLGAVLLGLASTVPVPVLALGPGPTFDTLGDADGKPVVTVSGLATHPTSGHLNMTTISVSGNLTTLQALGMWLTRDRGLVPRYTIYDPGATTEQINQRNADDFALSELNAEQAALSYLHLPTRAVVHDLVADSAAKGVLLPGDEVVSVAGKPVDGPASLSAALVGTTPGQAVPVVYRRDGVESTATVTLGAKSDRTQGFLGVTAAVEPVGGEITISLGDVGGPSAGLMFALAVVDKLTTGELSGGQFVAGTGVIDADGDVKPIGGIPFKMRAAHDAGATIFLVPDGNCAEAAGNAPDGLRLVRVSNLPGAVAALEALRNGGAAPTCTP